MFAIIIFFGLGTLFFNSQNIKAQTVSDVALNKLIVSVSSTSPGSSPANAVDGNPATFWTSGSGGAQWLGIDLGQTTSIGTVVVKWGTNSATNYNIELSDDGIGFTVVRSGLNGDFNSSILGSGRYILIRTIAGSSPDNYQLASLEVYVAPPPTSTPSPTATPTVAVSTPTPTPIIISTSTPLPTKTATLISTSSSTATTATSGATIAPPTPTPTPIPCTLNSVSWSTATAVEGSTLGITVNGTNCTDQTVNLEVRRYGSTAFDDILANQAPSPSTAVFVAGSNTVTSSWTAERVCLVGLFGICSGSPTYYVKATVGGVSIDNKSNMVTVNTNTNGTGPQVAGITDNRTAYTNSQIPKYEKLELTFQVNNSVATNLQMPYDSAPPPGVTPGQGITVNGEFSQDNFQTIYTQPAFYYQDFDYSVKNSKDWIYPNGSYYWKVRFAPNKEGNWQYRLTATDASGSSVSSTQSFTVSANPNNHGFIKVSKTDSRYFEYEDGTYFPGLGYNMNFDQISWNNPVLENQSNFQKMGQNGIQIVRAWLSQWSIFGSQNNPWRSLSKGSDYDSLTALPTVLEPNIIAPGSDTSMQLKWSNTYGQTGGWDGNPCMSLGWMKDSPAVKPNTSYHVSVKYHIPYDLSGPNIASSSTGTVLPYGLVAKFGGWLSGSDVKLRPGDTWRTSQECSYPTDLVNQYNTGFNVKVVTPYATTATNGWSTLDGNFTTDSWTTTSGSNFLRFFYLALENVKNSTIAISPSAYIDYVEIKEDLGGGQYGPNIVSKPSMSQIEYFDQNYSYRFDKVLDLAKQNNVYLKLVGLEKGEFTQNSFDYNGNPVNYNSGPTANAYFYGNDGKPTKIYWLQQAYWRYLQARWGYSTNIHSWELLNEGDPYDGHHYKQASNFAKYMHQFAPNSHLVTTSNWTDFPLPSFWTNSGYQDLDYADVHKYIYQGLNLDIRVDKPTYGATVNVGVPADFYDSAIQAYKISMQLGAKQPFGANKPVMRGETGFVEGNSDNPTKQLANDTQGIWLHKYIWGGINSGGLIESYWYEVAHIYSPQYTGLTFDRRDQFGKYYNFIKDIPLSNGNYQDASATSSNTNLRAWGQKDIVNGKAHLWIDNKTHNWNNVVKEATGSAGLVIPQSGTITIPSMPQSNYTVSWYDTYTGNVTKTESLIVGSDGIATLNILNLASDVAVKLEKTASVPCTLTSASWSVATASQGSSVNLNVSGNSSCTNQAVTFTVVRNGASATGGNDVSFQPNPQVVNMTSGNASTTWIAESNPFIPGTSPQYYFTASIADGNTIDTKASLLTVSPSAVPTPTVTPVPTSVPATISLNPATTYQTFTGWEGTDYIGDPLKPTVLASYINILADKLVNEYGLNRIRLEIAAGVENSADYFNQYLAGQVPERDYVHCYARSPVNDDNDPNHINPAGFQFSDLDWKTDNMVLPLKQKLEANGEKLFVNLNFVSFNFDPTCPVGVPSYAHTFRQYNDANEYAELMLATFQHMQTKYGFVPDTIEMILEPDNTSFSGTLIGQALISTQALLSRNGFNPKYVVPSTTQAWRSINYFNDIRTVLISSLGSTAAADSFIKNNIQEISYHRYGTVPNDATLQTIANASVSYGIGASMLECWPGAGCNSAYPTLHADLKTARNTAWQENTLLGVYTVDTTNPASPVVTISNQSKFIRQYAKFIRNGAQRIEATTQNATFDPVAFINKNGGYVVVVNATIGSNFSIGGLPAGTYGIKYTTSTQYNIDLADQTIALGQNLSTNIPTTGVITIYGKTTAPTPTPVPCTLASASWTPATAVTAGTPVNLNINTTGSCANQQVNLVISKNGTCGGPLTTTITPNPLTLTASNTTSASWTSQFTSDLCGVLGGPNQYFFTASLGAQTITSTPLLDVNQSAGGPTPTPTSVPPTSTPTPEPVTTIFNDSFEGGNLNIWTATPVLGTGSTLTANTIAVHSGSYGLDAFLPATSGGNRAGAYKTVSQPASKQLWGKLDVNLKASLTTQNVFLNFYSNSPIYGYTMWVSYNSATSKYRFNIRGLNGSTIGADLSSNPSVNTWQTWKWSYDWSGTAIIASLWIDAIQVALVTDSTTGTFYLPQVAVGIQDWYSGKGLETYFDNVSIYTADPDVAIVPTATPISSASATPISTITPTPIPCNLTSASWGVITAVKDSTVNLNVAGNSSCNGKQVSFEVRRNGTLIDDISANIQPQTASISANLQASTNWKAEFNPLTVLGIPLGDPQYYFKANIVGDTTTIESIPRLLTVSSTATPTPTPVPTDPNDWSQVQKDAQHTGYSAETLGTNFKVAWTYPFQPDRVFPSTQAIIYQGKAIVGTEGANGQKPTVYALYATSGQANSGKLAWKFEAGGPILNSVAAYDNKIFFGAMDGAVYAIDSSNGTQVWKNPLSSDLGFVTAPVIADNKVMLGGQDGLFYALDLNDGHVIWKYDIGAPIFQTAAYNNGKVFFGGMDMYVYALNTNPTNSNDPATILSWKSQKISGMAFKDYWPVITQGKVVISPMIRKRNAGVIPGYPFGWYIDSNNATYWAWLSQNSATIAAGNMTQVTELMNAQDTVMSSYTANPGNYTHNLYILDEATGLQSTIIPNWNAQSLSGAHSPPCVDRDNKLIVPILFIGSGWARLDLSQKRIVDVLYDGYDTKGNLYTGVIGSRPNGIGNADENLNATCTANLILSMHFQEGNANFTGAFNQDTHKWTMINAGMKSNQMSSVLEGRTDPASVSNGMIYHISWHELVARTTN